MSEAFIVPPGQGRHLDLGTFEAEVLARSAQTSGKLTVLQTQAEAFYVLEGDYLRFIEELADAEAAGSVTPELLAEIADRRLVARSAGDSGTTAS